MRQGPVWLGWGGIVLILWNKGLIWRLLAGNGQNVTASCEILAIQEARCMDWWGGGELQSQKLSPVYNLGSHFTLFEIFDTIFDGGIIFPIDTGALTSWAFQSKPKKKLNPADASCAIDTPFASTHCAGTVDISRFPLIVPGHVTRPLNQSHNVYRGSRLSRQMSYVNSTQRSRGYILTLSLTLNMSQSAPSLVFCDITSHDVGGASDVMSTNMRSLPLIPANYKTL